MTLEELKLDCARKQKKGLHFILASVLTWSLVLVVELTSLPVLTKNLLIFCCSVPLMLMVFAMIFGAHLMPYSWLYESRSYLILSIAIPIMALIIGLRLPAWTLASVMVLVEVMFSVLLAFENKKLN